MTATEKMMLRVMKHLWSQVYNYSKCQCECVIKVSELKTKGIKKLTNRIMVMC